jgi:hypothetical protein
MTGASKPWISYSIGIWEFGRPTKRLGGTVGNSCDKGGQGKFEFFFRLVFGDKISLDDIMIGGRSKRVLATFSGHHSAEIQFKDHMPSAS